MTIHLPLVSVVVPTRNRASLLSALLASLQEQKYPQVEVVVVDDASTDGTPELLTSWKGPGHIALRLDVASGSYAARNRGWRAAAGEIIAFTDDDCLPQPGWLGAMVAGFSTPDVVAVQGVTLGGPGEPTPFTHQIDQRRPGPPYRTCNMAYRRDVLEKLGGFDGSLRWYADNIMGLRARTLGPIASAPGAVVRHPPRAREWRDRAAWGQRFRADAVHRRVLHELGVEPVTLPGKGLPLVLWVLRPLVKQSLVHLRYFIHHPLDYVRRVRPMAEEKRQMLLALRDYWREGKTGEVLPTLSDRPLISVVIVTCDRPDLLAGALCAVQQQTWERREVLVVDNGASPDTRPVAEEHGARYLPASGLTLGAARQRGVEAAQGEILAFTDDDCLPDSLWLEMLLDELRRRPELHGVQGETAAEPGPVGAHAVRISRPDRLYQTCNMAYRRAALDRAGGFDPRFVGWFEDTALAARVLEHGPIGFAPCALVLHRAMSRRLQSRATWRRVLSDEQLLARAYPTYYRRVRGPAVVPAVIARWLVGSPLKTLYRERRALFTNPGAYLKLTSLLVRERINLMLALAETLISLHRRHL